MNIRIISTLLLLCFAMMAKAQFSQAGQYVTVTLRDGRTFQGLIVESTDDILSLKYDDQTVDIDRNRITDIVYGMHSKDILPISELKDVPLAMCDYHFLTPNALAAEHRLSYRNIYLFGQQFSYGFNDRFTLQFGTELASILIEGSDARVPVIYLSPKVSFAKSEKMTFAISPMTLFNDEGGLVGMTGIATYGDKVRNISFGTGRVIPFEDFDDSDDHVNVLYTALTFPLSNRISFTSEIFLKPVFGHLSTVRLRLGQSSSFDVGFNNTDLPLVLTLTLGL